MRHFIFLFFLLYWGLEILYHTLNQSSQFRIDVFWVLNCYMWSVDIILDNIALKLDFI